MENIFIFKAIFNKHNIPNFLTTFRVFLVPIFLYYLLIKNDSQFAAKILILSGVTDMLDGYIARRFNLITNFGKVYDPLADKITQISVVLSLNSLKIIPNWITTIIVLKEVLMIIIGLKLYLEKSNISSNWYGKIGTIIFYLIMLVLIKTKTIKEEDKNILIGMLVLTSLFPVVGYMKNIVVKNQN